MAFPLASNPALTMVSLPLLSIMNAWPPLKRSHRLWCQSMEYNTEFPCWSSTWLKLPVADGSKRSSSRSIPSRVVRRAGDFPGVEEWLNNFPRKARIQDPHVRENLLCLARLLVFCLTVPAGNATDMPGICELDD